MAKDLFESREEFPPNTDLTKTSKTEQVFSEKPLTSAPLPGQRKYPMDVVNVIRPRKGHGY